MFTYSIVGPLILRLAVALACFRIGWHKKHDWTGRHFRKGLISLGGVAMLVGFLVQPVAIVLIILFAWCYWREPHMDYWLLVAILLALLVLGPGLWAIDLPL